MLESLSSHYSRRSHFTNSADAVASNMKAKQRHRFDVKALRELAGDKVFARGEDYHRDGQVLILSIRTDRVVAQVAGTEDYRTELSGRGANIEGQCSCRAFADWGFCKHMVATAFFDTCRCRTSLCLL